MLDSAKIIAEIGVNHNGDLNLAKDLVLCAREVGANYAKFQLFTPDHLVLGSGVLADYQSKGRYSSASAKEMLNELSISAADFHDLVEFGSREGIEVIASVFSVYDLRNYAAGGSKIIKIPSGEMFDQCLLTALVESQFETLILSTGMLSMRGVSKAVELVEGGKWQKEKVLMQCTSEYPCALQNLRLSVLSEYAEKFKDWVLGFSDHSVSLTAGAVAFGLGARWFEKHLTLDSNMDGPDHAASLDPDQFKQYVENIRDAETMLRESGKVVGENEKQSMIAATKLPFAKRSIRAGEFFTTDNTAYFRSESNWISGEPVFLLGQRSPQDFDIGDLLVAGQCQ